ncbi:partial starch synthase (maltosyl-transferring), partial [Methylacidimicrobium cyclopophantes]
METCTLRSWPADGRRRAVVSRILPEIDDPRFPVKRALGEALCVQAHVFSDGHDRIEVRLRYRHQGDSEWRE